MFAILIHIRTQNRHLLWYSIYDPMAISWERCDIGDSRYVTNSTTRNDIPSCCSVQAREWMKAPISSLLSARRVWETRAVRSGLFRIRSTCIHPFACLYRTARRNIVSRSGASHVSWIADVASLWSFRIQTEFKWTKYSPNLRTEQGLRDCNKSCLYW